MYLEEYLDDRAIIFFNAQNREEAIEVLSEALHQAGKLKDKIVFNKALLDREKLTSTGIGLGLAIPHAKLPGYEELFIAVGIQSGPGIEWGSLDGSLVRLVFMIGGPDNKQSEYLSILSRLTTAVKDEDFRKALFQADSAQQVKALFKGY